MRLTDEAGVDSKDKVVYESRCKKLMSLQCVSLMSDHVE